MGLSIDEWIAVCFEKLWPKKTFNQDFEAGETILTKRENFRSAFAF